MDSQGPERSPEPDKGPVGLEQHSCIGYYYLYIPRLTRVHNKCFCDEDK